MKQFIQKIAEGQHLTREEAAAAMRTIMEGNATAAQIAALLIGMKLKEEQPDELLGFVEVMREKAIRVSIDDPDAIDMCGTGGDGAGTFNISTVASFVVAGAGVTVAKHGNRSISSNCGSADVLKALGVNIELPPEKVEECINAVGIGFLFAPLFHPAMKYAAKPRSELGVKTCFNMLGPMTNPAGVRRQLVGAFSQKAAEKMAAVFDRLGVDKVFVICSHDGMDEISLHARTTVHDVDGHRKPQTYELDPSSFPLPRVERSSILGGTAETNANLAIDVLKGTKGPHRDIVLANASSGLLVAGKAHDINEGIQLAAESIDSGKALDKLNKLRNFTNG
ncbi:MAG: anthranilate phosphoribosyltransferase [Ignavibacteriae bacterium]|nr:anthranilate phosphoribosyltransferase [Ignavibacteria bacterium]MBI3363480.1 anthranilate phosphoribosyltransferase [Ignavibacteriota bacterium]